MKRTSVLLCACLMLGAGSAFAQDRALEDQQTPNAAPSPNQQGPSTQPQTGGAAGSENNLPNRGLQGNVNTYSETQVTLQQCRDLMARERNTPGMQKDNATMQRDKACADLMNKKNGG
jgi:hypothetical protein